MDPAVQLNSSDETAWHVASLVVYCQPESFLALRECIEQLPYAEVHTDDGHAKMVVTVEGNSTGALSDYMDNIRLLDGTLSVQMVFHQQDDPTPQFYSAT